MAWLPTRWYDNINNYQMQMQFLNQHFGGYVGTFPSVTTIPNYQPVAPQKLNKIEQDMAAILKLKAAIAAEKRQQEDIFKNQLDRNLQIQRDLKEQLQHLESQMLQLEDRYSPESQRLFMKNAEIQLKLGEKLKTTNSAIDLLSDIIREDSESSNRIRKHPVSPSSDPYQINLSPTRLTQDIFNDLRILFPEAKISAFEPTKFKKPQFNYIHYDPEMHWCKECDCFPKTANDYLKHLHSKEHEESIKNKPTQEPPWHLRDLSDDELSTHSDSPQRRIPIQGVQHLIPATAWFCKLCNKWMGDLHCATLHLKSKTHFDGYSFSQSNANVAKTTTETNEHTENYPNYYIENHRKAHSGNRTENNAKKFLEQNPHWEVDWMCSRQRTYEKMLSKEYEIAYPLPKTVKNTESRYVDLDEVDKDKKIRSIEICRELNSRSNNSSESEDNKKNKWEDKSENKRAKLKRRSFAISPPALHFSDNSSDEKYSNKSKSKVTFKITKSSAKIPKLSSISSHTLNENNVFKRYARNNQSPPKFTSSDSSYYTSPDARKKYQKVGNFSSSSESER